VPIQAGKLEALEYVRQRHGGFPLASTVACGDSGNDILMLSGGWRGWLAMAWRLWPWRLPGRRPHLQGCGAAGVGSAAPLHWRSCWIAQPCNLHTFGASATAAEP
jgi:hypothetical protein